MRWIFLALLFVVPTRVFAQDKPNALTAKEIADGWLLLFDGVTDFGWTGALRDESEKSTKPADVVVAQHALEMTGKNGVRVAGLNAPFGSFELSMDYRVQLLKQDAKVEDRKFQGAGLSVHRSARSTHHYLEPTGDAWGRFTYKIVFDGKKSQIDGHRSGASQLPMGTLMRFDEPPQANRLELWAAPDVRLQVKNLKLKPLGMNSLFNGKDLMGWSIFPEKKSMFTVTKQGEINVKDGPGDLQTDGKFGDFILQLECLSNGRHLNSGLFFRCRAGEYQNGYEAQIRNQFTPEATQAYVVEDYDPQTNKLIGKRKIMGTAVDYGTGAIYRRQPARKEMSRDGEWFAMTVLAHGNHLATWVNGVQVADWHDHRPKSDNARTGCRLEAGHISIQGHDPTTDLSFRNLRIGEYSPR